MGRVSETQKAKQLYSKLVLKTKAPHHVKLGLRRYGLRRRWVWVAYGNRAYFITDMSLDHLKHTIKSLVTRHPEELRKPLQIEYLKRMMRKVKKEKQHVHDI